MAKEKENPGAFLLPKESIIRKIYYIRGKKVMFDADLAELYGVETKVLNQAVKRNLERFPSDFMFQLNEEEVLAFSRSQIVTLKRGKNIKYKPNVFTEQGVAMLSSVLKSKMAIQVNIQIIRIFTKLREMLASHDELRKKINIIESKLGKHDKQFQIVFEAIRLIMKEEEKPKREIGFKA